MSNLWTVLMWFLYLYQTQIKNRKKMIKTSVFCKNKPDTTRQNKTQLTGWQNATWHWRKKKGIPKSLNCWRFVCLFLSKKEAQNQFDFFFRCCWEAQRKNNIIRQWKQGQQEQKKHEEQKANKHHEEHDRQQQEK